MKTQIYSNPLIPMMAITGDLSRQQIAVILQRYLDKGITQFLMYPRDGCDVPYMSERWLTICRDFIETAASLGMEVWLYDEFNWPSGTCFGRVMEEDPAYAAKYVLVENGTCRIEETRFSNGRIPDRYADILQPDAVECFLRLTHEVYYKHFAPWFGTVIRGSLRTNPLSSTTTTRQDTRSATAVTPISGMRRFCMPKRRAVICLRIWQRAVKRFCRSIMLCWDSGSGKCMWIVLPAGAGIMEFC